MRAAWLALAAAMLGGGAAASDPTFHVRLDRGPCFGTCPTYTVEMDARGRVTFTGRAPGRGQAPAACLGRRSWRASPGAVEKLEALVDRSGFFGFESAYRANITDLPQYTVTVTRRGRTKTVADYAGTMVGMPRAMVEIENAIDAATGARTCFEAQRPS
jgi:hypothetical protein